MHFLLSGVTHGQSTEGIADIAQASCRQWSPQMLPFAGAVKCPLGFHGDFINGSMTEGEPTTKVTHAVACEVTLGHQTSILFSSALN